MKKLLNALSFVLIVLAGSLAAVSFNSDPDKSLAQVDQTDDGYYIFMQSKPVAPYEVLGSLKKGGFVLTGEPTEM